MTGDLGLEIPLPRPGLPRPHQLGRAGRLDTRHGEQEDRVGVATACREELSTALQHCSGATCSVAADPLLGLQRLPAGYEQHLHRSYSEVQWIARYGRGE